MVTLPTRLASASAPVAIVLGQHIDDTATPLTYEQSRYVFDMMLHYGCRPFFRDSEEMTVFREEAERLRGRIMEADALEGRPAENGSSEGGISVKGVVPRSRRASTAVADTTATAASASEPTPGRVRPLSEELVAAAAAALAPKARLHRRLSEASAPFSTPDSGTPSSPFHLDSGCSRVVASAAAVCCYTSPLSRQMELSMWSGEQPPSDVFTWCAGAPPPVGSDELGRLHSHDYLRYLMLRETLSDVDERASSERRCSAEAVQPPLSRRPSISTTPAAGARAAGSGRVEEDCPAGDAAALMEAAKGAERPLRELLDLVPAPLDSQFGLVGDSAPFMGLLRTVQATAGGTLAAARWLVGQPQAAANDGGGVCGGGRFAAIHWPGGGVHVQRSRAAGLHYINDVALAALTLHSGLPPTRNRVLVVSLDPTGCGMGCAVDAPIHTLSIGPDDGAAAGSSGNCTHVALPVGATDAIFVPAARRAVEAAVQHLAPFLGAVVLVCGPAGVQGDPAGRTNYTIAGLQYVIRRVIELASEHAARLLVLGGGGRVNTTAARVAGVVTRDVLSAATARQMELPPRELFFFSPLLRRDPSVGVPESCESFARFGPCFLMHGVPAEVTVPKVRSL